MRESVKAAPLPAEQRASSVELRIPSKAEWVGVARLAIAGVGNRLKLSIEDIEDLKLAVAEACTLAIGAAGEDDEIHITCEIFSMKIVTAVANISKEAGVRPASFVPSAEPQPGSLGLFLIRSLMDDVKQEADQHGVRLVLTKYFGAT